VTGGNLCLLSLRATNGNDRTIVLNQEHSFVLRDERGASAPLRPPAENAELVVPPGNRLDGELVFDCRSLDLAGPLTLSANRGTAGTSDNPYDTLPVFSLQISAERAAVDASATAGSHAAVVPIARSQLTPAAPIAAAAPPPPAAAPAPAAATGSGDRSPAALPAPRPVPKSVAQLEAALHATRAEQGLRITLPADTLFGSARDTLDPAAASPLSDLAALIAATHPRLVVIAGHTDSTGSDDDNLALSKARAHAVAAWLQARFAKNAPHLVETGYGRTRPVAPNHQADGSDNPVGREQNRRIEITLRR
jgi:outer membrane protein OmpA-like peptidoglycan-associated protein